METATSAAARLRRTFAYPDDSHDSQPEALDEEEQEHLIARLAEENAARNAQFRQALQLLPLLCTLPYLPALLRPQTTVLSLLAVSSLLSTLYLLRTLPPSETGIPAIDRWIRPAATAPPTGSHSSASSSSSSGEHSYYTGTYARRRETEQRQNFAWEQVKSPLEAYLPYLNVGLCVVLVLTGWVAGEKSQDHMVWMLSLGNLPAVVLLVVFASKAVMGSVDPERELGALKYEYKGA